MATLIAAVSAYNIEAPLGDREGGLLFCLFWSSNHHPLNVDLYGLKGKLMPCYSPKKGVICRNRARDGILPGFQLKLGSSGRDLRAYGFHSIGVPCQQCFGCRRSKAGQYGARCLHELSFSGVPSCMLTLTYDEAPDGLNHQHWQQFSKNLRWHFKQKLRVLMCGEYGDLRSRPHFHCILFGEDFSFDRQLYKKTPSGNLYNSRSLDMVWPHGWATINDVTIASAMYVGGYCYKKINSAGGEPDRTHYADGRRKEYVIPSRNPAIGVEWLVPNVENVFLRDECLTLKGGVKMPIPRAYKEFCAKHFPDVYEEYQERTWARIEEGNFDIISDLEDKDAVLYATEYDAIVRGIETEYVRNKRSTALYCAKQKFERKTSL